MGITSHVPLARRDDVNKVEPEPLVNVPFDLYDEPNEYYRDTMIEQITRESHDECSDIGHQRQAWLILSEQQEDASPATPAVGRRSFTKR